MSAGGDDGLPTARELARQLEAAREARIDDHEDRLRAVEAQQARAEGAAGGFAKIVPWLALAVGIGSFVWNVVRH